MTNLYNNLTVAIEHRVRLGAELIAANETKSASPLLVEWYEDALEVEKEARAAIGREADAQKVQQMRDACMRLPN